MILLLNEEYHLFALSKRMWLFDRYILFFFSYTLLVGKPPFETSSLQDTYLLIKKNEYHIPSARVSSSAKALILRLLKADPSTRPSMTEVLQDPFFTSGEIHYL